MNDILEKFRKRWGFLSIDIPRSVMTVCLDPVVWCAAVQCIPILRAGSDPISDPESVDPNTLAPLTRLVVRDGMADLKLHSRKNKIEYALDMFLRSPPMVLLGSVIVLIIVLYFVLDYVTAVLGE